MGMSGMERGLIGLISLAVVLGATGIVGRELARYRVLIRSTLALAFVLVILGAFVRLSDAGLGCPDWPGCYGNLTPHHSSEQIKAAEAMSPGGPVSMEKAWKEMVHRYLAMFVGSLIAAIMLIAWRNRREWRQSPWLPTLIACAVIFQAALGAWTVTMLLKPAIVTSHLLGGVTILTLLSWLLVRQPGAGSWTNAIMVTVGVRRFAGFAALVLFCQIVLGGWVSTNYAALACADLPTCHGEWMPAMDFANAFHVIRPLGVGPDGELLRIEALRAIHWVHRLGAIITAGVVGILAICLLRIESAQKSARMLLGLLFVQLLLGISNVYFGLPLGVAVAHNGVASMLFVWIVIINLRLSKKA
jgi:cytochrome c oxidase assembly protein subunit 15